MFDFGSASSNHKNDAPHKIIITYTIIYVREVNSSDCSFKCVGALNIPTGVLKDHHWHSQSDRPKLLLDDISISVLLPPPRSFASTSPSSFVSSVT